MAKPDQDSADRNRIAQLLAQGRSLHEAGRRDQAMQFYRQVIQLQPDHVEALNNLAIAFKQEKQYTLALAQLRHALAIEPNAPYLHNNLANILWQQGEMEDAKQHYQQALGANPDYADAWYGLGNVFASLGELDLAVSSYQQALTRNPNHIETYNNLGNVLQAQGKLQAALDCHQKTLQLNPNHTGARWNQGFTLLLGGDLQRGFIEYECRWQMRGGNFRPPRNFSQPLWDGSHISGKTILLHCEQGFGDTIQFIRYFSLVKQKVGELGRVLLECPKPLLRLFQAIISIDQLIPEGQPLPEFDVYAPLMSLPRILGTTLETIPAEIPYIYPVDASISESKNQDNFIAIKTCHSRVCGNPSQDLPYFNHQADHKLKIGILWAGKPFYKSDISRYRACSPHHFWQLFKFKIASNPQIQVYSLQKEISSAELSLLSANNIVDIGSKLNDFADTANAIASLDLVITIDTAVAHLAGAMGKPVWVLLPFAPDWRWMLNRLDSPWYPTMKLFRPSQPGDWDGIFQQVKYALKNLITNLPESSAGSSLTPLKKGGTGSGDLTHDLTEAQTEIERRHKQGVMAYQAGNLSTAVIYYRQVLEINPNYAKTHNNLAIALKQQGNLSEAIAHYRQAITFGDARELPLPTIYHNLANTLEDIGEFSQAIAHYRQAINQFPDYAEAHYNLARLLKKLGNHEQAIAHYRQAIKHNPNFAQAYSNLGNTFKHINQLSQAIHCYQQAISIQPNYAEAHWNLGLTLLLTGELQRGFAEYEWRWQTPDFSRRSFTQPLWDGTPLNGKTILLYSSQGLGDHLQFIRYVSLVAQQAGRIIVESPPPLARLFQTVPYIQEIVIKGEALPEFDFHFPLISLPHLFGTTLQTIPAQIPYLFAPISPLSQEGQGGDLLISPPFSKGGQGGDSILFNPNLKIGIVWAGNPNHKQDALRSCELKYFLPLLNLPGIKLYSLQKGDRAKDLAPPQPPFLRGEFAPPQPQLKKGESVSYNIENLGSQLNDFADTAAVVNQLDLVITVDTAVAHLVGGMGRPVWLLLGNHQDWRWMQEREDSPWYPTMRIFRQSQPGDWEDLLNRVVYALEEKLIQIKVTENQDNSEVRQLQQIIAQQPNYAEAYHNLGYQFKQQGNILKAIAHYQKAVEINPEYFKAHYHLGNGLLEINQITAAIAHYQAAIQIEPQQPDARTNLGFALLISGDLTRGFAEYEWRLKREANQKANKPANLSQPAWDGSPMPGKTILLYTEEGFGDSIQFIRYVPLVAPKFAKVIVQVTPELVRLFQTLPEIDQIILETDNLPDFDVQASLMSLPHLLGTSLESIPAKIPYLSAPIQARSPLSLLEKGGADKLPLSLLEKSDKYYKIGIVWAGSDRYGDRRNRSCQLAYFYNLMEIPGLSFYSLQVGPQTAELTQQQTPPVPVIDLGSQVQDFADTAKAIAQLDLVITIDTSVAHLAAAMGKTVWVLLPFAPDWRWMLNRLDSPWYPTMRLFRQPYPGDWNSVFHQIKLTLISSTTAEKLMNISKNARLRLGLGWQLSQMTGWGVYGMNLTLQLLTKPTVYPGFYPILLMPHEVNEASLNPLHRFLLQPIFSNYKKLEKLIEQNPNKQIVCDFPVIHALGKNLASLDIPKGNKNIGVVFLEDTHMPAEAHKNSQKYDIIIAGSTWNEQVLKHQGISHVFTVQQGIDPTIFHPAPKSNLWGDRFVIFSGGKLEYRKGQDITIAAFKEFRLNHPDALLITAWHNFWPEYMHGLEQTGNVVGLPQVIDNKEIKISDWLIANGLPPDSFIDLGIIPNHQMGQILREADVAIFTSRCEGGTNLFAMESMACGIPTILSANTGHLDLINDRHCYPLSRQLPVQLTPHFFRGMVGWGESDVNEVVLTLETVYGNRKKAQKKGLNAANFMENWTWEKQVQRFLSVVRNIL